MKKHLYLVLMVALCATAHAKIDTFYAPKTDGTNGLVLVSAGANQDPYWVTTVTDKTYSHAIYCYNTTTSYSITFTFINAVSTAYTSVAAVSQALYNLGYDSETHCLVASGYTGKSTSSKGGYVSVFGTNNGGAFNHFVTTEGKYDYGGWSGMYDIVTPVSSAKVAVNVGVNESGLSFDDIYPVGSIYLNVGETLPPIFKAEGRTWVRLDNGLFLMSTNSPATTAGATGGANSRTLTTANMPSHSHGGGTLTPQKDGVLSQLFFGYGSYSCGPINATGAFVGSDVNTGRPNKYDGSNAAFATVTLNTSGKWTGATSSVGSGAAFDNRPYYIAVSMWKRTN